MDRENNQTTGSRSARLLSLDVFRGLVILAMLFVNDLSGVRGVPAWMLHAPTAHDGMTFVDLVFPCFLFMVGMSIPFALGRREARPWGHMLIRTASLAFLGFLEINGDHLARGGFLSPEGWYLLEGAGVLLVWNQGWKPGAARALRLAGWGLLGLCMVFYRGAAGAGLLALRPEWWGILGLIGWAYLSACLVVIPSRGRPSAVAAGMVLFLGYAALLQAGFLAGVPGLGSATNPLVTFAPHGAITLAGVLLGQLLLRPGPPAARVAALGAALGVASVLAHLLAPSPVFIISKNLATVTWCLRASAYATFLWLGLHLAVDKAGWRLGTGWLREAGGNALLAYLLAPVAVAAVDAVSRAAGHPGVYDHLGLAFRPGLLRASVHALLLTWLAGRLFRRGVRLKL